MGFNKRRMDSERNAAAAKEAAARRALGPQITEDSVQLVEPWNARQAERMSMLFSPTIGAAITGGYWYLRASCPACRTTGDVDPRTLDWHRGAAVTALTPALSCRSAERAVCRTRLPVQIERGRRVSRRAQRQSGGSASEAAALPCGAFTRMQGHSVWNRVTYDFPPK